MEEIWKPIAGYEGLYEVSNLGRVRGLDRLIPMAKSKTGYKKWPGKIMAPDLLKDGYYKIGLHKDGKKIMHALHRVVAEAFVPGRTTEKNVVNHKDCNRQNCRADNLEWCTTSYNIRYDDGLKKRWDTRMMEGKYINPPKAVMAIKNGKVVGVFKSLIEAGKFAHRTSTAVYYCCSGKTKHCGGYSWKYL